MIDVIQIIAEAGVNHNGRRDLAHALVEAAQQAGADTVKFQTFRTQALVTGHAMQARYQMRNLGQEGLQAELLRGLELGAEDFAALRDDCVRRGLRFLSTPFDKDSASFLVSELGCDVVKIGSGDMDNLAQLVHVARLGPDIILSTGMATLGEIELSLGALAFGYVATPGETPSRGAFMAAYGSDEGQRALAAKLTLLHCTTEYPAPFESLNLRAMGTIRAAFGLPVGFSDHSEGHEAAVAALALGATVLEKHITLDRTMPGPDHAASLEPAPFGAMVKALRNVEAGLGDGLKRPQEAERGNIGIARKAVVAAAPIGEGEVFTEANLTVKRTRDGLPASAFFDLVGQRARRAFAIDEAVS